MASNLRTKQDWFDMAVDALEEATRDGAAVNHRQRAFEDMRAYADLALVCALETLIAKLS